MSLLKIITTHDGSHSLLNEQLNETYHSVHGAWQESNHVFIEHGLACVEKSPLQLLEIGFGTGLNALLSLQYAVRKKITIYYTTLEVFPVDESIWSLLNYANTPESTEWFKKIHHAEWNDWAKILHEFHLRKLETTLQTISLENKHYDLIYFDAFAPSKQPEMWEKPLIQKVVEAMKPNGIFVTYCAKGQLKRDLQSLGMQVETLQGPPGKREMVRAKLMN
jgi:tRNA U34 5-methylaminomethyl-2-thiouridine-forming methyltransferase MnmC